MKRKPKPSVFVLKAERGTYFQGMSGIGPMLGGTLEQAARFSSRDEALMMLMKHWSMGECVVVEVKS